MALIAAVVAFAFLPSLSHVPRGDQWAYLLDMLQQNSCRDLIAHSYSYNRTRVIAPGDEVLFRPLFFVYLSIMTCWSGSEVWLPQAAGILLHLGVAWVLFFLLRRLLREITGRSPAAGMTALLVALYFATTPAIIEQVIWAHIHAYMLAALCVLGTLFLLVQAFAGDGLTPARALIAFVLLLLACFTYETTLALPVVIAFCSAMGWLTVAGLEPSLRARMTLSAFFLAPIALYCVAYFVDLHVHRVSGSTILQPITQHLSVWDTLRNGLRLTKYSVAYPFLAGAPESYFGGRLHIVEPSGTLGLIISVALAFVVGAVMAGLYAARALPERPRRITWMVCLVALTWLSSAVLMYTFGRANLHQADWGELARSSYRSYTMYLSGVVLVCVSVAGLFTVGALMPFARRGFRGLAMAFVLTVIVAIMMRAWIVRSVNVRLAALQAPFLSAIERINKVRRLDPFATFRISAETAEKLESFHGVPNLYTLFARSIDQCEGTYEILPDKPYLALARSAKECHPKLVWPRVNYNFFSYRGEIVGLPVWFGFPNEKIMAESPYAIRAPNLYAAAQKYPQYQERLYRDLLEGRLKIDRSNQQIFNFR